MNKNTITKLSISAVIGLLLVVGFTQVKAQSAGFWDAVAQQAGQVLGNRIELPTISPVDDFSIGSAGDTESTSKISQIQFSGSGLTANNGPTVASTTVFSLYNSSSRDRVIESITLVTQDFDDYQASSTIARLFLQAATSTDPTFKLSSTNYLWNDTVGTSSAFSYVASSTPGIIASTTSNRIWGAGTYIVGSMNDIATSTGTGFFRVNYSNIN